MPDQQQPNEHIVKSYDEELRRLTGEIQRMGALALEQLGAAIDAVMLRDGDAGRDEEKGGEREAKIHEQIPVL